MEFVKVGDQYINMNLVKYVLPSKDGLEIFIQEDIIPITGDSAKYLREVLDGSHVAAVAEINRKMPSQNQNK